MTHDDFIQACMWSTERWPHSSSDQTGVNKISFRQVTIGSDIAGASGVIFSCNIKQRWQMLFSSLNEQMVWLRYCRGFSRQLLSTYSSLYSVDRGCKVIHSTTALDRGSGSWPALCWIAGEQCPNPSLQASYDGDRQMCFCQEAFS